MKFSIIIFRTNKLTIVEMEDIRDVRLRKFKLRKIILGVRMHFRHMKKMFEINTCSLLANKLADSVVYACLQMSQ